MVGGGLRSRFEGGGGVSTGAGHTERKAKKVGKAGRSRRRSKNAPDDPAAIARAMAKIHIEEGDGQYKTGLYTHSMKSYNLALELQPEDIEALVSRSRCHLAIGQPKDALKDAEAALAVEPSFIRGIYQKAEALYHLGDFEHSLMFYHRGHKIRPEMECFRLGVQKAQEAIKNTVGKNVPKSKGKASNVLLKPAKTIVKPNAKQPVSQMKNGYSKKSVISLEESSCSSRSTRQLLGQLCIDKNYLENLLRHPDIKAHHQEGSNHISGPAEEAIAYLNGREEFWRQQKTNNN